MLYVINKVSPAYICKQTKKDSRRVTKELALLCVCDRWGWKLNGRIIEESEK